MANFIAKLAWVSIFALSWLILLGWMDERKWAAVTALILYLCLAFVCAVAQSAAERRLRNEKGG